MARATIPNLRLAQPKNNFVYIPNYLVPKPLAYDQIESNLPGIAWLNGNIAQLSWKVMGKDAQAYGFTYDYLNRVETAGSGARPIGGAWSTTTTYDATYGYDKRGNIQTITRRGLHFDGSAWQEGQIDNLTFDYHNTGSSNQLQKVTDAAAGDFAPHGFVQNGTGDYTYDANGNLERDPHKGITISYNYLNLPQTIAFDDGRVIEWLYDAAGVKLRKTTFSSILELHDDPIAPGAYQADAIVSGGRVATGSNVTFSAATGITLQAGFSVEAGAEFLAEIAQPAGPPTGLPRDYVGGIEYYNGIMEAIYHAEGRVSFDNGQSLYEYNLTDHLGNLRLSFADRNGDGDVDITSDPATNEVLQEHHYYPFGMAMKGEWVDNPVKLNRYRYNGIERQDDFGLNWDIAEFRSYDAAIGRWMQIDPIIKFPESPFVGFTNNPISFMDPFGADTLKQIGPDTFDGGYLDGPTISADRVEENSTERSSDGSAFLGALFANRFENWQPIGTGEGLSVNPNFPQYSEFAEDVKQISWNMLSPVLLGVAGGGMSGAGNGMFLLHRIKHQFYLFRLSRLLRSPIQPAKVANYVDDISRSNLLPLRRAPRGGIFIGEKFYAGGQFLPGSRTVTYSRQFINPEYLNVPALSNSLRPSPVFYPNLNPLARWTVGGGGAGLGLYYGLKKNRPK